MVMTKGWEMISLDRLSHVKSTSAVSFGWDQKLGPTVDRGAWARNRRPRRQPVSGPLSCRSTVPVRWKLPEGPL